MQELHFKMVDFLLGFGYGPRHDHVPTNFSTSKLNLKWVFLEGNIEPFGHIHAYNPTSIWIDDDSSITIRSLHHSVLWPNVCFTLKSEDHIIFISIVVINTYIFMKLK